MRSLSSIIVPTALAFVVAAAAQASSPEVQLAQSQPQTAPQSEPAAKPAGQAGPSAAESKPAAAATEGFVERQEDNQLIGAEIVGLALQGEAGEKLGEVGDLILDEQRRVVGVILSVGGFLGLGAKPVAVPWESIRFEMRDGETVAVTGMTEQQLAAAPEFESRAARREKVEGEQQQMGTQTTPSSPSSTQ
jgi:sporulation protein YlmC with PRC-barrel domain